MVDFNFSMQLLANKVSVPVVGLVDGTTALLAGGIAFIALVVVLYKIFHRKKALGLVPPEHGQQAAHPAPWKENKPGDAPRRLRRLGAQTEMPEPEPKEFRRPIPASTDKSGEIARQLKGETVAAAPTPTSRPRGRTKNKQDDLESLAEDLADQNEREERAKKELEELRKKLGMPKNRAEELPFPSVSSLPEAPFEQPAGRRHGRWREQRAEKKESEGGRRGERGKAAASQSFQRPTESEAQLEQLKKMGFKDLLKETNEARGEKSEEEELKELEGEEGEESLEGAEEGPKKCPNCKRQTDRILYCPECGTGFCKQCAKSFKKQGNNEFYQCPNCEAYVKAGHD